MYDNLVVGVMIGVSTGKKFFGSILQFVLGVPDDLLPFLLQFGRDKFFPNQMGNFMKKGEFPSIIPGGSNCYGFFVPVNHPDMFIVIFESVVGIKSELVAFYQSTMGFWYFLKSLFDISQIAFN